MTSDYAEDDDGLDERARLSDPAGGSEPVHRVVSPARLSGMNFAAFLGGHPRPIEPGSLLWVHKGYQWYTRFVFPHIQPNEAWVLAQIYDQSHGMGRPYWHGSMERFIRGDPPNWGPLGMKRRQVFKILRRLEERGLIFRRRGPYGVILTANLDWSARQG